MAWATDLIQTCRTMTQRARPWGRATSPRRLSSQPLASEESQFRSLRRRLLWSFLGVMTAVVGLGSIAAVEFFIYSLYQQVDRQLFVLAQAAAHSLEDIAKEHSDRFRNESRKGDTDHDGDADQDDDHDQDDHPAAAASSSFLDNDFFRERQDLRPRLDNDGDLDIPWQNLQQPEQGVEWFDPNGRLLARQGAIFPHWALIPTDRPEGNVDRSDRLRSLTAPIYKVESRPELKGYVRVTESIQPVNALINHLVWGMAVGSGLAIGASTIGGLWLTRQSLRPIQASFRQLRQFTADASHELRGPLTAIRTSVEVMQSHPERLDPVDTPKLAAIHNATTQMTRLVEDLLLLARQDSPGSLSAGRLQSIDLQELLEELLDTHADRAAVQGLTLTGDLHRVTILGDPLLLWRLFTNLLDNALTYTPRGGDVRLVLTANPRDRLAQIQVRDTGIGIAPADLPHVFDRLWRADRARSHADG
ncbi:MAG TPA: HAMP domain-containing sensor histidine kinase, partial [Coleofasciculaceae cyanobacterium]